MYCAQFYHEWDDHRMTCVPQFQLGIHTKPPCPVGRYFLRNNRNLRVLLRCKKALAANQGLLQEISSLDACRLCLDSEVQAIQMSGIQVNLRFPGFKHTFDDLQPALDLKSDSAALFLNVIFWCTDGCRRFQALQKRKNNDQTAISTKSVIQHSPD